MSRVPKYVYRIAWKRVGTRQQSRTFTSKQHATTLYRKLTSVGRPDLPPLEQLETFRVPVGGTEWEPVEL